MTDFQLDTTDAVEGVPACRGHASGAVLDVRFHGHIRWSYLDAFTQGYIEALFTGWSLAPQSREDGGWDWALTDLNEAVWWCDDKPADAPAFKAPRFTDLAPETLARIITDCAEFQRKWSPADPSDAARRANGALFWAKRSAPWDGFPALIMERDADDKVCLTSEGDA